MKIWPRWTSNFGLGAIKLLIASLLFPWAGVSFALLLQAEGIGLFNLVQVPVLATVVISVLGLDLSNYCWHRLTHAIPLLWRFHLVHHSDQDVDFSTGLRNHPVEAVLSTAWFLLVLAVLGAPPLAVFLFLVLQAANSIIQHGNLPIPVALDRGLRLFVVTPDMHRIHHSARRAETDSNFTGLFSFWDRLFGTYVPEPQGGHQGMVLGLEYLREPRELWMHRLLLHPFLSGSRFRPTSEFEATSQNSIRGTISTS